MSYEKDKLDSFVTSASLSTALAPYITSASVSSAIAGINLAPYVTSDSISAAVATDTLTVRGGASVSATLSAGAVTVAGRPVGAVLLGYRTIQNVTSFSFSGSWSDFHILEVRALYRMSGTSTASIAVFTDGGTTPILSLNTSAPLGGALPSIAFNGTIFGSDGIQSKWIVGQWFGGTAGAFESSGTANSGFVNCFRLAQSQTMSQGVAALYGWRKA